MTNIGSESFDGCWELTDVICEAINCPIVHSDDYGDNLGFFHIKSATLYVPEESVELYKNTEPWSQFGNIKAIGTTGLNGVTVDETNETQDIYGIDGKRRHAVKSGVNIIHMRNGKTKKVLKK